MLAWFIAHLNKRIKRLNKPVLAAVEEYRLNKQVEEALALEHSFVHTQAELMKLENAYALGQVGILKAFWQAWGYWNQVSSLEESLKPWWRQTAETIIIYGTLLFVLRYFIFGLYSVPSGSAEPNMLVGDRILGLKYPYLFGEIKRGDLVIFDAPNFVYDQSNPVNRLYQKYIGYPIPIIGPLLGLTAGPDPWTKRVIGLPGDTIEGKVNAEGKTEIYLNGELLDEPYLNPYPLIAVKETTGFFPVELGMPSFLNYHTDYINYTYDPAKPYNQQPFYDISSREIVYNQFTGKPFILNPRSPGNNDKFPARRIPEGKLWVMGDNRKNSDDCRSWGFLDKSLVIGRASRILFSIDSKESFWLFSLIKNPIKFFTKQIRWKRTLRAVHPFKEVPKN